MPNNCAQFQDVDDRRAQRIKDLDEAFAFMVRDMGKLARGEIQPHRVASFAKESLLGASLITKRLG